MAEKILQNLASMQGITIEPVDGKEAQSITEDTIATVLSHMDIDVGSAAEMEEILERRRQEQLQNPLDPVHICEEGTKPYSIPLRFPEGSSRPCQWILTEENGSEHTGEFIPADLAVSSTFALGEERFVKSRLELNLDLPCGYHEFVIQPSSEAEETRTEGMLLAVSPRQCFVPPGLERNHRIWGPGVHLHAVRSKTNWGTGDFSDLHTLLNWAAEQGAGILGTTPLYATSETVIRSPNPYISSCRSMLNILFLDVEEIADLQESDEAKERLNDVQFQARLSNLRESPEVDYLAVLQVKNKLLEMLWHHFSMRHLNPETGRGREFRDFQQQGGDLLRYYGIYTALYRKLQENGFAADWTGWPEKYRSPQSQAVLEFAGDHPDEIEYHQYLQWQADSQLGAVGRRSMERGLRVGLLQEYLFSPDPSGFETWYYNGFFLKDVSIIVNPEFDPVNSIAAGMPLYLTQNLQKFRFRPLIETLRHAMRFSGALLLRSLADYHKAYFKSPGQDPGIQTAVMLPFADIMKIIALESQRNSCLIIADDIHLLPEELQGLLAEKKVFSNLSSSGKYDVQSRWLGTNDYPVNGLASSSPSFSSSLKGFWSGRDIAVKSKAGIFRSEKEKENAIIARNSDRAHILIALNHADLLPEGYEIDPAAIIDFDQDLISAIQIYLAKTVTKIVLLPMTDLLAMNELLEPPALPSQEFWSRRYPETLASILVNKKILSLFETFLHERGVGVTRPSAPATARRKGKNIPFPNSFYRLQLSRNFTFRQAIEIIPYLKELGISHCYVSPLLMARPGSSHGYDIIDHSRINPEIGSRLEYEQFVAALEENRMAMILDTVPNHMGVGSDNKWWMDVLENGEASEYAHYFDINWHPQQQDLIGRVLLPVLGDHYGTELENGRLNLRFDADSGSFSVHYYEKTLPIDPQKYPMILGLNIARLEDRLGGQHSGCLELQNLLASFNNLPDRRELSEDKLQTRRRHKEINKRILARLCREYPEIQHYVKENVVLLNGEAGKPASFDPLHNLLEKQAFRLAYWRVAADEINYRRFFDINDLACLRMEKMEVFRATHSLVLDLVTTGKLDGLRIDHPDGLYDPATYFYRLQEAASGRLEENQLLNQAEGEGRIKAALYIVIEKILADSEHLPRSWPVHGTTGYDFLNTLNGLFIDPAAEKAMTRIYNNFIGENINFDELVYTSKRLIIRSLMSGELNVLASSLYRLAQLDRKTRDYRLNRLREALMEIIACFPVYRTYITPGQIHKHDVQFIEWGIEKAKRKEPLDDIGVYDFIKDILLLRNIEGREQSGQFYDFCMKFQQYTGPVMAKGLEDTAFYIYNRLLSLNEVGGEPKRFGTSVAAFHHTNLFRLCHWPHAMLNTSTHDTKRNEDSRARINVLTEMPDIWRKHLTRWSRLNRSRKSRLDDIMAPTRNDEYAYYQNLIALWPLATEITETLQEEITRRMKEYMIKACREAKRHTSWITPSEEYEAALTAFVESSLKNTGSAFMQDFMAFHLDISWFGMLNSLSQVLLKLVSPGIPDIYQGNETWHFCLVDPDNRRPVDFNIRQSMLHSINNRNNADPKNKQLFLGEMLDSLPDGRAKLFTIAATLRARNEWKEVFEKGSYLPLKVDGAQYKHICPFARLHDKKIVIAAAPLLLYTLLNGHRELPIGNDIWHDTTIFLPEDMAGIELFDVYSGKTIKPLQKEENTILKAADIFRFWPVGLLRGTIR